MKNQAQGWFFLSAELDHVIGKLQPVGQFLTVACVVNKLLLEHSHAHLFMDCLWLLSL